jgi:hypothetical protein
MKAEKRGWPHRPPLGTHEEMFFAIEHNLRKEGTKPEQRWDRAFIRLQIDAEQRRELEL